MQIQIRRYRTWRLIRVLTVCRWFSHFSLGISNSRSWTYLKLKLDSSNLLIYLLLLYVAVLIPSPYFNIISLSFLVWASTWPTDWLLTSDHTHPHHWLWLKRNSIFQDTRLGSVSPRKIKIKLYYDDASRPPPPQHISGEFLWLPRYTSCTKIQTILFIPTLDTTTKSVIMSIWLSWNFR